MLQWLAGTAQFMLFLGALCWLIGQFEEKPRKQPWL